METNVERVDAFLEHHGVKGMKWGVRKQRRTDAKAKRKEFRLKDGGENRRQAAKVNLKRARISAAVAVASKVANIAVNKIPSNNSKVIAGKNTASGVLNLIGSVSTASLVITGTGAGYHGVKSLTERRASKKAGY